MIDKFVNSKIDEIRTLCKRTEITKLYIFGSAINGNFKYGESDIDLLIEIKTHNIKQLVKFQYEVAKLFRCKIDIFCTNWRIHKNLADYLESNKILIYKRKN